MEEEEQLEATDEEDIDYEPDACKYSLPKYRNLGRQDSYY